MIINKTLLAKYSPLPIPSNFDYTDLLNYVTVAEQVWLAPLVGDDLLEQIRDEVEENNLSDEVAALMIDGFLVQYLAYATVLESLPILWSRFTEVGIVKGKSENSDSLTLKDLTYVEAHIRRQVEVLKDSVKRWLCEHSDSFPALDCCRCSCNCCSDARLNRPNPYIQLYTTPRLCTDLH